MITTYCFLSVIHSVFYSRFLLPRAYYSIVSIFFRSKIIQTFSSFFWINQIFKKAEDEDEEQNKKDNPKVILYEFLNLIENQK